MSFLRHAKLSRFLLTGTVLGSTALFVVPEESLPDGLYQWRVNLDGILRFARSAAVASLIALDYKWAHYVQNIEDDDADAWSIIHSRSAERLRRLAEHNGALYIKAGQSFASVNHILPPEYCRTLIKLNDSVDPRPFAQVERVLLDEFKHTSIHCKPTCSTFPKDSPLHSLFADFDPVPIAAASLAQVHRARLRDSSLLKTARPQLYWDAAIKVQYLDVSRRFSGDLWTISTLFRIAGYLFPGFDFSMLLRNAKPALERELYFVREAHQSERCAAEAFTRFGGKRQRATSHLLVEPKITCPEIVWPLTRERVLTMEFIEGIPITDVLAKEKETRISGKDAMSLFVDLWAHQLFCTGFIHADPHGGNVLVRPRDRHSRVNDPKTDKWVESQLVILDHGLYVESNQKDREWLARLYIASCAGDNDALAKVCEEVGVIDRAAQPILASMFLCTPYSATDLLSGMATAAQIERTRNIITRQMDRVTGILEVLPPHYPLMLRNINHVRSVNRHLGVPVRRVARMLTIAEQAQRTAMIQRERIHACRSERKVLSKDATLFQAVHWKLDSTLIFLRGWMWLQWRLGRYWISSLWRHWILWVHEWQLRLVSGVAQLFLENEPVVDSDESVSEFVADILAVG